MRQEVVGLMVLAYLAALIGNVLADVVGSLDQHLEVFAKEHEHVLWPLHLHLFSIFLHFSRICSALVLPLVDDLCAIFRHLFRICSPLAMSLVDDFSGFSTLFLDFFGDQAR